jgi:ferredoxin
LLVGRVQTPYVSIDKNNAIFTGYDRTSRQQFSLISHKDEFKDGRKVFTEEQVKKETGRCLGCGAAYVDPSMCIGCGQCTIKCKFDAIHLERTSNEHGIMYEKLPLKLVKHLASRGVKIIFTPQKKRKYRVIK